MREVELSPGRGQPPRRWLRFWIVSFAALATIALTISLGRWQLSRAAQKEALQARIDAQKQYPALDMESFLSIEHPVTELHRTVRLRGLWLPNQTVYLDNRQMRGTPGFYVLTPLALEGTQQTVMVQRGWVQRNFVDRAQLPPVDTPAGLVDVTGQIEPPPARLYALGKEVHAAPPAGAAAGAPVPAQPASAPPGGVGSSAIRQNLDLEGYRAETGLPLRTDISLQQGGAPSEGLQRDWPAPALGVEKHYGYAFQWFGLAALVAILYVWFQFASPRRRRRHG